MRSGLSTKKSRPAENISNHTFELCKLTSTSACVGASTSACGGQLMQAL